MARLFLLFSHQLQPQQRQDAREHWQVTEFVELPPELQAHFSAVPPEVERIADYAWPLQDWLLAQAIKPHDRLLVQGEYGLTHYLVNWGHKQGWTLVYATTPRQVTRQQAGQAVTITRQFSYVRFRYYEFL